MSKKSKSQHKTGPFRMEGLSNASKTLLANIRFAAIDQEIKTLVITSTAPNEGKTTVATNLACAIAASGKRVLVVDTDMRRRCIGDMLGVHPDAGMFAVLAGEAQLADAIYRTDMPNLFFMDTEKDIASPSDVLATRRFRALAETLGNMFDYVVYDTPPLSTFVDAAVLAQSVDGVIYVIRKGATRRQEIEAGLAQLYAAEAHVLGTVLTFTDKEDSDYYYYAYYNKDGKRVRRTKSGYSSTVETLEEEASQATRVTSDFASDDIDEWGASVGIEAEGELKRVKKSSVHGVHSLHMK